jgi:xanthine dehydrogenase YagR molybdenum-binding subunit
MAGWKALDQMTYLGQRYPRVDGPAKVTGRAKYTSDVELPGMLYAKVLGSPHPHARITRIDASKAMKLPGVKAVLTSAEEVRGGRSVLKFVGDAVAAVAAVSEEIAEDALERIEVEYETLPFVVDTRTAMRPESPRVHSDRPNIRESGVRDGGDLMAGFEQAEVIVEGEYSTQVQIHTCFEAHGSVAHWDGDELTIWDSTQAVHGVKDQMATHLGIPASKVKVICHHMGGGFGSKLAARYYTGIAARLAKKTGAPVKLVLSRRLDLLGTGNRPDSYQHIKLGAKKDGTLVAADIQTFGTPGIAGSAGLPQPYIYKVPNYRHEHRDVYTNVGPAAPMRAPGHPQASFAMEAIMDELAEKLGIDPLELRKKNDPSAIRQRQYDIGAKEIGWHRRQSKPGADSGRFKRGLGVASCRWGGGGRGTKAEVSIHPDGSVEVRCGTQDIGTGTRTIATGVVAEELGLPLDAITVLIGESTFPYSGASGGSTTAASVAPALKSTTEKAKQRLFEVVAPHLRVTPSELELAEGEVRVAAEPHKRLSWKEATSLLGAESIQVHGEWVQGLSSSGVGGVQFAEVEVDTDTGKVRVIKVVAVHGCGLVVDRLTAESQINGGVVQGIGYALLEARVLDLDTGAMVNPNLEAYKIPGALEIPEIVPILVDEAERGVIGLGEPPVIPTAAAIANAVYNACGVRVRELPITPDRLLLGLARREARG